MATWRDLERYVRGNYKVTDGPAGMLSLDFDLGPRSQVVFVRPGGNDDLGEWATVLSAIGPDDQVNLGAICEDAFSLVVGGVVKIDRLIMLAHSIPLADLDVNEFEIPLKMICIMADVLEAKYRGGDYA